MAGIRHVDLPVKNEWLADLLMSKRDFLTECWIEDIRATDIPGYRSVSDERLRVELPPTVDSMIYAFRTGDTEGPRRHSHEALQKRLANGFYLPDLQMSLYALETAVMQVVREAHLGPELEYQALQSAANMYYMVALIAAGVYEQLRAEQQKRFITAYEFGITLSQTLEMDIILNTAVNKVSEYIGGDSVVILLANPESGEDEVRAFTRLDPELAGALPEISRSAGCRTPEIVISDMYQSTCSLSDVRAESSVSAWSDLMASHGVLSMVCAQLVAKQNRLGTLLVLWSDVHAVSPAEMDFLLAMSGHIANAVQNALLYDEAKGKKELEILLEASKLFASTLDTQDILSRIARIATEVIKADLAIVFTKDQQPENTHTAYHLRSRRAAGAFKRIIDAVVAEGEENGFGSLGEEFAGGKPVLYHTCAELPGRMQSLRGIGASGLVVPLKQKDTLLGAFAVISMVPEAFTEEDLPLASGLADLAGIAIENAQLYEYERHIAEAFQRNLLPTRLPTAEGYETSAYYRPAMAEAEIGGDLYDVFMTGEGKIAVIIGDVSGKGLKSAIPITMGKYIVRAYGAEDLPPVDIMTRFNRAFLENAPEGLFMTALYGVLDPMDNVFTYVSAGHDPPLLYSAESGRITQIQMGGICLGITPGVEYVERKIQLQPGDTLLMYTDGATDVKGDDTRLYVEGLEQLFLSCVGGSAEEVVRSVSDGIWNFCHGRLNDDVALVVIRRLP